LKTGLLQFLTKITKREDFVSIMIHNVYQIMNTNVMLTLVND